MNKFIIDILKGKIYSGEIIDDILFYNSEKETEDLLVELARSHYENVDVDDKNDLVEVVIDNKDIVLYNFSILGKKSEFAEVKKELRPILQREKLKKRKNYKIKRMASYFLAVAITVPNIVDTDIIRSFNDIYLNEFNVFSVDDIRDSEFSLKCLDNNVLQGICTVGENTLITAYDAACNGKKSMIYILDKDNNCIGEKKLYNDSHAGGICYDKEHNLFWITDKLGTISGYTYDSIFHNNSDYCFPKFYKIDVGSNDLINNQGDASAGYVTYHRGKIFVGNFSNNGKGILKSFKLQKNGNIDLSSAKKAKFFNRVQGVSFYENNGDTYLLTSISSGRYFDSKLMLLKYTDDCNNFMKEKIASCAMPPMMEQITVNDNGQLLTLYESNANIYKKLFNNDSSDVVINDIEKVVVKLKNKL